jgi:hypothetical protein
LDLKTIDWINFGAMGILSAILFYLHTSSLKTFAKEQKFEREMCEKHFTLILAAVERGDAIVAQTAQRAADASDRNRDILQRQTTLLEVMQNILEEHHGMALTAMQQVTDIRREQLVVSKNT